MKRHYAYARACVRVRGDSPEVVTRCNLVTLRPHFIVISGLTSPSFSYNLGVKVVTREKVVSQQLKSKIKGH